MCKHKFIFNKDSCLKHKAHIAMVYEHQFLFKGLADMIV
jgi:hypothetical protein